MSDWTAGYVVDRDAAYTYGYYNELNPLRVRFAFLMSGLVPPQFDTACELGYGQGLSVNMNAAAGTTRWWGTDFNASQASFAQELAAASGAGADLVDEAFGEFCTRDDLPDFDYIGLHGIWSWISDENRALLVDFARRKLKVGGVFYISYNTHPGWAAFAPMRHLLAEHAEVMAVPGRGMVSRVDAALDFADRLLAVQPRFAIANPQIADRVKRLREQNRNYLAHEYFNQYWAPVHFSEMADWVQPSKLDYACPAHPMENLPINLTEAQRNFLGEIPDRMFRETVRDFMINQQFRRDYWVRGVRTLTGYAQVEALRRERFVLGIPAADMPKKVTTQMGDANLHEDIYRPLADAMADNRPHSLGELEQKLGASAKLSLPQIAEAITILLESGVAHTAQSDEQIEACKPRTDRLNVHLMNRARSASEVGYLASPVTGGAIAVAAFHQLFLLAHRIGRPAKEWGQFAWEIFGPQGQKLIKEGKVLQTPEENRQELDNLAREFAEKRLAVLQALQVA
jgi:SAM-dependent methyltransferase